MVLIGRKKLYIKILYFILIIFLLFQSKNVYAKSLENESGQSSISLKDDFYTAVIGNGLKIQVYLVVN